MIKQIFICDRCGNQFDSNGNFDMYRVRINAYLGIDAVEQNRYMQYDFCGKCLRAIEESIKTYKLKSIGGLMDGEE